MSATEVHIVTGAFGYSGRSITQRLLEAGVTVMTLTNSPQRTHEFEQPVKVLPLAFDHHDALVDSLRGCDVLYNTYWVRFNHRGFTMQQAVDNTKRLFAAAREAGVGRVVHTSIANPSIDSPFEYYRGKAALEQALSECGLSHSILRPTVLFGGADILMNNMAWAVRHLPVVGLFGDGNYHIRPMHVDDFAALAIEQGAGNENTIVDAVGPEAYTYRNLLEMLAEVVGCRVRLFRIPKLAGWAMAKCLGVCLRDVMLTWEEIGALCADLLWTQGPSAGSTSLKAWAEKRCDTLGVNYASELARRRDRTRDYSAL